MKVYVDQLPKDCEHCPCKQDIVLKKERLKWVECNIQNINKTHTENIEGHNVEVIDCPLELIADHDKERDHRIAVLERAFKKACKNLAEVCGECPYANMNLKMPDYCEKECEKHEELLCWDNYFIDQAEKELKDGKD